MQRVRKESTMSDMAILLKGKVLGIVKVLKKAKKDRLANCIEQNWHKTALQYSKELNFWRPKKPIEKELLEAFDKELERLDIKGLFKSEILDSIKKRRVLQTAPHLGATESPRMLCLNWLGSLGLPENHFYIVGMFSGIPFSNRSRPGRINRKSDSVNLFPSNLQDGLVYRSTISNKLIESIENLPREITRDFPRANLGDSYTKWALKTCENIEKRILNKKNLVYLDINEVISSYLERVLLDSSHILHKIFFNKDTRKEFTRVFPNETLFYTPVMSGKYEQMENMTLSGDNSEKLKSKNKELALNNPEVLIQELKENRLCPAMITTFLVLAFLNQFKCFGSFAQVEYLPVYQEKLSKLSFMKEFEIENIPTSNLTTGVFPEKKSAYPADIIIKKEKFKPSDKTLFGELLLHMKSVLLESYFTGDTRKK